MKASWFIGTAITAAAMLTGCASTSGARGEPAGTTGPTAQEKAMGTMRSMCPMQVPGTTVASADVEGGIALSFTTSTGDVADLRQRVRRMAEMHNRHHAGGMLDGGAGAAPGEHEHGAGPPPGRAGGEGMMPGAMMMPAATASVEDIEGGARLVLRPKDMAQLEALRQQVRMHAGRMAGGECPMMSSRSAGSS